ncbi:MAG: tetratricopeptide repeat protein [Nitrospirae bacterium]|nr:tetratricopeptide repeat protein [Nitrospirota bacterium]
MALDDIEKLKARLDKDPGSKLFVPLAEEYRKAGMYDEAIDVLLKELQKQPSYTTARVALGKIYLEMGHAEKAREEFEKVIEAVPDNLFAQKKLSEIYSSAGDNEKAVSSLRKILELNPRDEEARERLEALTGSVQMPAQEGAEGEAAAETLEALPDEAAGTSTDALDAEDAGEEPEEGLPYPGPEPVDTIEFPEVVAVEGGGDAGMEEYGQLDDLAAERAFGETSDDSPMFAMPGDTREEEPFAGMETGSSFDFDDMLDGLTESAERPLSSEVDALLEEADGYIDAGQYMKAVDIYSGLLDTDPDNKRVRQRVEELKHYLKMIGKDTGSLIGRLESFYEGLKNRRDEFFGSS